MSSRILFMAVLVTLLVVCVGCNDDDDSINVIEPGRLEYIETPTPTPIYVGDDAATDIVQDVRDTRESVDKASSAINELNCALGLDSCITATTDISLTLPYGW